jgi:hypothetical protein
MPLLLLCVSAAAQAQAISINQPPGYELITVTYGSDTTLVVTFSASNFPNGHGILWEASVGSTGAGPVAGELCRNVPGGTRDIGTNYVATQCQVRTNNTEGTFTVTARMPAYTPVPIATFTINNYSPVTLVTTSLANGSVSAPYSQALSASSGNAPYSYSVVAGSLPAGLNLAATGTISGTPTEVGTFSPTIQVADNGGTYNTPTTASRQFSMSIAAPTVALAPSAVPAATVGVAYSSGATGSGGTAPYSYSVASGTLPPGLVLDASSGLLSGQPTTTGTYAFSLGVTDSTTGVGAPYGTTRAYSINVQQGASSVAIVPTVPTSVGQQVTFTANVTPALATGSVIFSIDGVDQAPVALIAGSASHVEAGLSVGSHSIGARYLGDANYTASGAAVLSHTVNALASQVGLTGPANSTYGNPATFAAAVTPVGATGSVVFAVDGVDSSAAISVDGAGNASWTTSLLAAGQRTVTARYLGDGSYAASTSGAIVTDVAAGSTAIAVTAVAPTPAGHPVTFVATLTPASATGSVIFTIDGVDQTPTIVAGGQASISVPNLSVGAHVIGARYLGAPGFSASSSANIAHLVNALSSQVTVSGPTDTAIGEATTFVASVTSGATGSVVFAVDGVDASAPLPVDGSGNATWVADFPAAGTRSITARYLGDALHAPSVSASFDVSVAQGSLIIRVDSGESDGVYGFTSPTAALNVSVATTGGQGSVSVPLANGTYQLTGNDVSGLGLGFVAIACSTPQSSSDLAASAIRVVIADAETVTCTFRVRAAVADTTHLIEQMTQVRGQFLLSNLPDIGRRIDRLNGTFSAPASLPQVLLGYLPHIMKADALSAGGSLAAIEAMSGNAGSNELDVWLEATFARVATSGRPTHLGALSAGADYVSSPDLLVGGFVQVDQMRSGIGEGNGWLAGPYATLRLSQALYLDVLAAFGRSDNAISPYSTYSDRFSATRYLLSASLSGSFSSAAWTVRPLADVSIFSETSDAYSNGFGLAIPSTTTTMGRLTVGPSITYELINNDVLDIRVGAAGLATFELSGTGLSVGAPSVEGSLAASFSKGGSIGVAIGYRGFGIAQDTVSARANLRLPVQ